MHSNKVTNQTNGGIQYYGTECSEEQCNGIEPNRNFNQNLTIKSQRISDKQKIQNQNTWQTDHSLHPPLFNRGGCQLSGGPL